MRYHLIPVRLAIIKVYKLKKKVYKQQILEKI